MFPAQGGGKGRLRVVVAPLCKAGSDGSRRGRSPAVRIPSGGVVADALVYGYNASPRPISCPSGSGGPPCDLARTVAGSETRVSQGRQKTRGLIRYCRCTSTVIVRVEVIAEARSPR